MNKYETGTVFELFENDIQEYVILDSYDKGENVYVFATPVEREKTGVIRADYTQVLLVRINKSTDEMKVETDEKIIEEATENLINKVDF